MSHLDEFADEVGKSPDDLAAGVQLSRPELVCVLGKSFRVTPQFHEEINEFVRRRQEADFTMPRIAKELSVSVRTLQKLLRGSGVADAPRVLRDRTILQVAQVLGIPFRELADPDDPERGRTTGPKPEDEDLKSIESTKNVRILFRPHPALCEITGQGPNGFVAQQISGAVALADERYRIEWIAAPDNICVEAFLKDLSIQILVCTADNHPDRGGLDLIRHMAKMDISLLVPVGFSAGATLGLEFDSFLGGKIAVYDHGFSEWYLKEQPTQPNGIVRVPFPPSEDDGMRDLLWSRSVDMALGNRFQMERLSRIDPGRFRLCQIPLSCHYSIWARSGQPGLVRWLQAVLDRWRTLHPMVARSFNQRVYRATGAYAIRAFG